ncbi:4'-phosphopantetheinyl transferase family protein [Paenalcaligenes sp. Me131]|uniref:4'-phosphopantetheinyl transferase family protein n=1 Tax=Paenalcaligenes sp. Me131 TaxID=3392636 RepID=UPI003D26D829
MNTIYVYHLHTHIAKGLPSSFFACLRDQDWAHVNAARQPSHQQIRKLAYATTYHLLAHHNRVGTHTVRLMPDTHGKPHAHFAADVPLPCFNISHSHELISIAVSSLSVGVDVEHTATSLDTRALAQHFFAEPEAQHLHGSRFFAYWTSKEALLKAHGNGLRTDPVELDLLPPTEHFQPLRHSPATLGLQHHQVSLCPAPYNYCCAVASSLADPLLQTHHLQSEQLHRLLH